MPCYSPLAAFKTASGDVVFSELKRHGEITQQLTLPCGQCIGCKLERSRQWAARCIHESQLYKQNCFITLTYADEHLPWRNSLDHGDFQKFMKRLRKAYPYTIRYFMGGEYGEQDWRPHFHACLFNHDWNDKTYWQTTETGNKLYRSEQLEQLWPYGHSTTGALTFQSAAYVARYCTKVVNGDLAEDHYKRYDNLGEYQLTPEYGKMSLKPGIGANWLELYKPDVYNFDHIIVNGQECTPPKYYDKLLKREDPELLAELKERREWTAYQRRDDNTPERLHAKQQVQQARYEQLKRKL